jgi:hypothetical protein
MTAVLIFWITQTRNRLPTPGDGASTVKVAIRGYAAEAPQLLWARH